MSGDARPAQGVQQRDQDAGVHINEFGPRVGVRPVADPARRQPVSPVRRPDRCQDEETRQP